MFCLKSESRSSDLGSKQSLTFRLSTLQDLQNSILLQCHQITDHFVVLGYDIETRPHGSSSGYHSDDASLTQKAKSPSLQEFHMPDMLGGRESPFPLGKVVHPKDVIITVQ